MNPFTPFGNGSLIRMTNLHANTLQIGQAERIAECSCGHFGRAPDGNRSALCNNVAFCIDARDAAS